MTDDRPRPKYGEYAPVVATPAVAPPVAEVLESPAPSPRRAWDIVLTTFLLLVGVYDIVTGFGRFADLGGTLANAYSSQGFPAFTSMALATTLGLVINISRVVILAVTIALSLVRLARGRIAFWIPLAGAALGLIVVFACVLAIVMTDPALAQYVAEQAATP